ncbi:MAG: poly(A) polymerase [Acidobacteriota bacterium]|nr:poly(A) polymerase [Acidobacteriota bacterium]
MRRAEHPISRRDIDHDALKVLNRLHRLGFTAYLCGGAVRDLMLGRTPKDFDIVTDARPGQIRKRFANAFLIGRRFRLAHVRFQGGKVIEVATFRKTPLPPADNGCENAVDSPESSESPASAEAPSSPGPPAAPDIYGTPREDAFRRDVTINALFYNIADFSVIDYVGGLEDIAGRRIRVIGDPGERFAEDPVRVWRVVRHAARIGFDIDEATALAIPGFRPLLTGCSGARLYEELNKDLKTAFPPVFDALRNWGLLRYVLGKAGEAYEADSALFARLRALLAVAAREAAAGRPFSLEEMHALLFQPWLEPRVTGAAGDVVAVLNEALMEAQTGATIPRTMRAGAVQILSIAAALHRALRTGRMRASLRNRAHFQPAARLCFLFEKSRLPEDGESFDRLFAEVRPSAPRPVRRRRRRKPGPKPPDGNTDP